MYRSYDVTIEFTSPCHGGVPQAEGVMEKWIDARAAEGEPFILLGDFNRRFDILGDTFWPEIDDGEPANADLSRVTKGKINECWNKIYPMFIDHIVLDRIASDWIVEDSFSQLVYTEGTELKKKLSDHRHKQRGNYNEQYDEKHDPEFVLIGLCHT